jgi:predicted dehydrogenase
MSKRFTRRSFLKTGVVLAGASAAAAALSRGPIVLAAGSLGAGSPNSKLGVAVVGVKGMMGGYSTSQAINERCVAMCDVDEKNLAWGMDQAKGRNMTPKTFFDFRKMLDECSKDIDVVLVAIPDHVHAAVAIRAINLGKAVFCQKPMAYNIYECGVLANAAKEKKVATQMGNQRHCEEPVRRMSEFIWAGAIGTVTEAHTILGRNFGGDNPRPPTKPVPAGLHWEEWIGPAPYRDYHDKLHPQEWRNWRDFGTGTVGDMACHWMDFPFWGLKVYEVKKFTVTCIATKGGTAEMYAHDNAVVYDLPAHGTIPALKWYVYDHGPTPGLTEIGKKYNHKDFGEGSVIVGDKGCITNDARTLPEELTKDFTQTPRTLPRAHGGPIEDLFWAVRNNSTGCSNFTEWGGPLTSLALTSHLAQRAGVGKAVEWDMEKMQCTNIPELNQYIKRPVYRKGWEV